MSSNRLPDAQDALRAKCIAMIHGCEELQNEVSLMHTTAATLNAALTRFESKDTAYQAARAAKGVVFDTQQAQDKAARAFIQAAGTVLRRFLGRWSEAWEETGYPNQSTAVPATLDERMVLLRSLQSYFTAHADYQQAGLGVTVAAAGTLYTQLAAARDAVAGCVTDVARKKAARDAALEALRGKMQDLVNELSQLLDRSDVRWVRFGLNIPEAPGAPGVPEHVRVSPEIPGKMFVTCDPVVNAAYYRFWTQPVGGPEEPVAAGTSQEPQFLIEGLAPGQAVRVLVSAVNAAGRESPRSEAVTATPLALAA